jgi:hypothetical protein
MAKPTMRTAILLYAFGRIRKLEEAIEQLRNDQGRLVGEAKDLMDKTGKDS